MAKGWLEIRYVNCGKLNCSTCTRGEGHGPYLYRVWRENGRRRARYLGPVGVVGLVGQQEGSIEWAMQGAHSKRDAL